jgi:hypothetical protein
MPSVGSLGKLKCTEFLKVFKGDDDEEGEEGVVVESAMLPVPLDVTVA